MSIRRFNQGNYDNGWEMDEDDEGDFVFYDDHRAEVEALRDILNKVSNECVRAIEDCENTGHAEGPWLTIDTRVAIREALERSQDA